MAKRLTQAGQDRKVKLKLAASMIRKYSTDGGQLPIEVLMENMRYAQSVGDKETSNTIAKDLMPYFQPRLSSIDVKKVVEEENPDDLTTVQDDLARKMIHYLSNIAHDTPRALESKVMLSHDPVVEVIDADFFAVEDTKVLK